MSYFHSSKNKLTASGQINSGLLFLGLAFLSGLIAVWLLRQSWAKEQFWPWILLIAVMIIGSIGLHRLEFWLPGELIEGHLVTFTPLNLRRIGLGFLIFSLILTGFLIYKLWPDFNQWGGTVSIWIFSMIFFLVGSWLIGGVGKFGLRAINAKSIWAKTKRNQLLETIIFIVIMGLAIFLRTYNLNEIPPGIYVDETNGALDALYILEGREVTPFGTGWYGTPNGYIYYMAGIFQLFGVNWLSLKLVSLIPAILTVPAVYFLARLMFGPIAGLSAMFLMAVSRWHLSMSRWGWNETAPPLFQVLAFFFLIRGLRDRRALDYAISGLLTGLMTYTYLSSRLAAATIILYIVFWFLSDPSGWRRSIRRSWVGIMIMFFAIFISISPILVTYVFDPFSFGNRVNEISILNDIKNQQSIKPLITNITDILKFFHQTGDRQGKHNLPEEPMADPVAGLLFAIGFSYSFIKWRDHRYFLLVVWLVLGLAGSFLSSNHESPQSYRSLTALPAVVILAGDVLDRSGRAFNRFLDDQKYIKLPQILPGLATGCLVFSTLIFAGFWESKTYFGKQATSIEVVRGFNPVENQIAHEVISAWQEGATIYLSPKFSDFSPLRFLVYGVVKEKTGQNTLDDPPYQVINPEVNFPVPDTGRDVLILLDTEYWQLTDYFLSIYPNAIIEQITLEDESPLYIRIKLTQKKVEALQGITKKTIYTDGTIHESIVSMIETEDDIEPGATIEWSGAVRLEHGNLVDFIHEEGIKVFVDGKLWTNPQYLGRGIYGLKVIKFSETIYDNPIMWKIGEQDGVPVPKEALFRISQTRNGLLSSYYKNLNWEGDPEFQQVTPFLLLAWPDEQPIIGEDHFSARFTGYLEIPESGTYNIKVEADDGARLLINGVEVGSGLIPGRPNDFEVSVDLAKGIHAIQLDYFQQGGGSALRLFWQFGENPMVPIPPAFLSSSIRE